jgi:hypothetical protein
MLNAKRLTVATLSGVFFGFVCLSLAASAPGQLPWPVACQIVAERTLMGVAIGISCLTLGHWSVHGLIMGMLFSIPLAFSGLMAPENPEFGRASLFAWTIVLGMIYGLLIELITSVFFKARK